MDLELSGKTALVTGSTAGIGYAIAERLAGEGATVYVNGRGQGRVDSAIEAIRQKHPRAALNAFAYDLGTKKGVDAAVEALPKVDILINNLGIYEPKPFGDIPDEDWMRFFEINVMSGIRLSRHYLPAMLKQDGGRIVFIASESGIMIPVEMIHYGLTKSAQMALASGLAQMTKGTGVTVNSVLPGPTRSEGVEQFIKDNAKAQGVSVQEVEDGFFETMRPGSLLQRFITTDEIANLVAYVASPLSAATNGAALRAEGGLVKSIL